MSRGQTPRTPEYFPRMKHRAAGRIARDERVRQLPNLLEAFKAWTKTVGEAMQPLIKAITDVGKAIERWVDQYFRIRFGVLYVRDAIGEQWVAELVRRNGEWQPIRFGLRHTVTDESIALMGDRHAFRAAQFAAATFVTNLAGFGMARAWEPWHHEYLAPPIPKHVDYASPGIMRVPHVDQDIVENVDAMNPKSLGQRVAIERTLQDRRDGLR